MAKNKPFLWPWDFPRRSEILPLAICIVFGAAFIFFYFKLHPLARTPRFGFGPHWECTDVPKGDPICIKRPAPENEAGTH